MLRPESYPLRGLCDIQTPALVFYRDIIVRNTQMAIDCAGGADRLWPHVKSHKMRAMIEMQREMGINRFKCATIAEAQMVADCGAAHILLAYPLVGPNITRFIQLMQAYPKCIFYAIGDDETQLRCLSDASAAVGLRTRTLLDINMGMNRTGIALDKAEALYCACAGMDGLQMTGLHGYDGHIHDAELSDRIQSANGAIQAIHALRVKLQAEELPCEIMVMGGTPTFPVHAAYEDVYLSPGTVFLGDGKCLQNVADLDIIPAAGIWTRVISHPAPGLFALDLGVKGISTDQADGRGILVGMEAATPLFQSEEHWVYQMPEGSPVPAIGDSFFVVPLHVCPATPLYPYALIVDSEGDVVERWDVTARNRSIGI